MGETMVNTTTLPKSTIKDLHGIPMTIGERAFVAIPLDVLQKLMENASTRPPKALPPGSVEATSYAQTAIARNLKVSRLAAKLTQAGMAAKLSLSQTRVSLAERGTVPVSTTFVKKWLIACGLPEDWKARS
jgi:DNA-binding XRE family transcriptional regulator